MNTPRFTVTLGDGPLGGFLLRDNVAGSEARVLPEVGANCIALRLPGPTGAAIDVLRSATSAEQVRVTPSRYGMPLLFPFPSRIRDGRYTFEGRTYQMPINSRGNAIHGFVLNQRFRVEAAEGTAEGAHLRCVIAHADLARSDGYPFPFRFVADYTLREATLALGVTATNTGDGPLPFGVGMHPYFRAPLAAGGSRDACLIRVPVASEWTLTDDLLPTGARQSLPDDAPLRRLQPLAGRTYDNVYGDVEFRDGVSTSRLVDPAAGLEVDMEADDKFREIVVYAPPGSDAVCFEPYTCATDAFNLNERGIDAGRLVLASGASWSGTMRIVARTP